MSKVRTLSGWLEDLLEQSQPDSMDRETYMIAQDYYDVASRGLESYLMGLESLTQWVETGHEGLLESSRVHFEDGDELSKEVIILALEAEESFKDSEEAIMRSIGLNPEGIGRKPPEAHY